MTLRRRSAVALLTLGLCLGVAADRPTLGQQPANPPSFKELPRPGDARKRVRDARKGDVQFNNPTLAKQIKDDLLLEAKYLIYPATDPKYLDPKDKVIKGEVSPPNPDDRIAARIADLNASLLVPEQKSKLKVDQVEYIAAFGEACGTVFRELNLADPNTPDYLQVNAGQMLAACGKTGAPALMVYVTELLNDPKAENQPEVLVYALKAAEGLLAAYNPIYQNDAAREHDHFPGNNKIEVYNLVKAVEAAALRDKPFVYRTAARRPPQPPPPPPPPAPPAGKADPKGPPPKPADPKGPPPKPADPKAAPPAGGQLVADPAPGMTPEQLAVYRFVRRQAVRALAQVRVPILTAPVAKGGDQPPPLRPLFTLAKFAVMDASLAVPPGPDEAAEATAGLCNLRKLAGVNPEVLVDCIAAGLTNYARPKTNDTDDKRIPWGKYAAQLDENMRRLKGTLDGTGTAARAAAKFDTLLGIAENQLLLPIFKLGTTGSPNPDLQGLVQWRAQNRPKDANLFVEAPTLLLTPADRRAAN